MKKVLILLILVLNFCCLIEAQVIIHTDYNIDNITREYSNLQNTEIDYSGWSILIAANQDRRKIEEVLSRFKYTYPQYANYAEWKFDDPYYKIIVGAFQDRLSLFPVMEQMRKGFPTAFEVKNTFPFSDIMNFRRIYL